MACLLREYRFAVIYGSPLVLDIVEEKIFFDLWVGRLSSVLTVPGFYDQVEGQRDRMAVRKIS
ncbi:hypothetical protein ACP90_03930 [Labrenzia sp. CP4]|nr:hypothetical protein ACP90_03930 [Labrenzia sp. CP4]